MYYYKGTAMIDRRRGLPQVMVPCLLMSMLWSGASAWVLLPPLARHNHNPSPTTIAVSSSSLLLGTTMTNRPGSALYAKRSNSQRQQDFIKDMQEPMETTVGDSSSNSNIDDDCDDETVDLVHTIVQAADGRKAENIVALTVSHITTVSEVLVVLSGNSRPQNQAIAAAILDTVQERFGYKPGSTGVPEGRAESGWMLLDYGSVIVHIMTAKSRLYYNVEGQWRDKGGTYWDLSKLLVPNNAVGSQQEELSEADDPFWS